MRISDWSSDVCSSDLVLDLAGRLPIWRRAKGRPFVRRSSGTARLLKGARTMAWIYLVFAGLLEIVWAFFMKKSAGFTLPVPSAITLVTMTASFILLSVAMKSLPLGIAYMIWTGIGAVGAFLDRKDVVMGKRWVVRLE